MTNAKTLEAVHTHTHTHTHTSISLKKSSKKLDFVLVQKIYIKYKKLKDGLCKKIDRPFCVQKGWWTQDKKYRKR